MMHSILYDSSNIPVKLGKANVTCFVLEDRKIVFTIFSLQKALGYDGKYENWLFEFLTEVNQSNNLDLITKLKNPIKINGLEKNDITINTIACDFLLPICQNIVDAKNIGFLNSSQIKIYNKAVQITTFLKNIDILEYVEKTIGYKNYKEQILEKSIQISQKQNNETAYIWIKTFPNSFIETIFDLNNINWNTVKQNPKMLSELFDEIVFSRIDNTLLEELRTLNPKRVYKRKNGKTQENEDPNLKEYLAVLQSLISISGNNWNIFTQLLNKAFPKQKSYSRITIHTPEDKLSNNYSNFNQKLINGLMIKK